MSGVLYLVATPIGNLEDVTLRALRILREVDVVAAEDTRRVRALLHRHGIQNRVVSYHEHNEKARATELLELLRSGRSVALVSDAGTPVLSDPGYALVRLCVEAGIPVVPVPGPSAITAALAVCGLPTERFLFAGFPPRKRQARKKFLAELVGLPVTLVLFESPRRLMDCLVDLYEVAGNRHVAVCRELTKRHEEVLRGTIQEVLAALGTRAVRGEVTLVVEGAVQTPQAQDRERDVEQAVREALTAGASVRETTEVLVQRFGLPRREAYRRVLALRKEGS